MLIQLLLIFMASLSATLFVLYWFELQKKEPHKVENIIEHRKDDSTPHAKF